MARSIGTNAFRLAARRGQVLEVPSCGSRIPVSYSGDSLRSNTSLYPREPARRTREPVIHRAKQGAVRVQDL